MKEHKEELSKRYGIEKIALFGSYARGEATDESDIDIVILESNIKLTYEEDLFLLDKLFQIKSMNLKDDNNTSKLKDKVIVIFGGSYGIGKGIKDLALQSKAKVYSFSRSENNTLLKNIA